MNRIELAQRAVKVNYSRAAHKTVIYIVCVFLCFMSVMPFLVMFVNATRTSSAIQQGVSLIPGDQLLINMDTLYNRQNFNVLAGMRNSLLISAMTAILALYFSNLTAFGLVAYRYRLRRAAFTFIMIVMMIPTQVSIIGYFNFMFQLGLIDTYVPLILPAIASPAVVFFMRQYMLEALPLEIVEAARIDGCSEFRTFNSIVIPMMRPALAVQAIFTFVTSWNKLFEPTMLISSQSKYTMPMLVSLLKSDRFRTDYGTVYLSLSLTVLPLFIVYFLLSRHIIAGVALSYTKE